MFKLLVIASTSIMDSCSIHQVVIEFERQYDADVAYERLVEKKKEVIKLY